MNEGSAIVFTLTVFNTGSGDALGVKLNDLLPTSSLPGTVASQGAGWAGTCSTSSDVLPCGGAAGVTVPPARGIGADCASRQKVSLD